MQLQESQFTATNLRAETAAKIRSDYSGTDCTCQVQLLPHSVKETNNEGRRRDYECFHSKQQPTIEREMNAHTAAVATSSTSLGTLLSSPTQRVLLCVRVFTPWLINETPAGAPVHEFNVEAR